MSGQVDRQAENTLAELLRPVDDLEDALASYFVDKDVPMEIRQAVDAFEIARAALSALRENSEASEPLAEKRAGREVERLRRFLTRIASADEITGDGATETMTGPAAYEMRARMAMAQRGLDGDEYP